MISVLLLSSFYFYLNSKEHRDIHDAHDHSDLEEAAGPEVDVIFHSEDEEAHKDDDKVAAELAESVGVLCLILTAPKNHEKKVNKL